MIRIDKLEISIEARAYNDQNNVRHFGRVLEFNSGLNLVVGDNTSGKTTLVECLFYAIGMEELIEGKKDSQTLDKAVKKDFLYVDANGNQHEWYVKDSFVRVQLSNDKGETITIKRKIVSEYRQQNIMYVWKSPMTDEIEHKDCHEYYVHRTDDHNEEYNEGFYALLAEFAGLPIVSVPARNTDKTLLYMQTVFSASYIEQKRGWSDFFANIRSFNIVSPKQKLIEYIMEYETNMDLVNTIKLKEQRKETEKHWELKVTAIQNYLAYNGMYTDGLRTEIKKQTVPLDELRIAIRDNGMEISSYMKSLKLRIKELETKQNVSQEETDNTPYQIVLEKYKQHIEEYNNYCVELVAESDKLDNISEQLKYIDSEIRRYNSLGQVNNIITTFDVKICPTCHQHFPSDTNSQSALNESQIQQSKAMLKMQKSFLAPMKIRLEKALDNKKLNKLYLEKQLKKEEAEVQMVASQNNINLSPLSTREQFELVDDRTKAAAFEVISKEIKKQIEILDLIKKKYEEIGKKIKELSSKEEKEPAIYTMLSAFRKLLLAFNYSSNNVVNEVFLKEDDTTYKYLPVVKHMEYNEEEIRSDSSASDFIRSIWAYYLTLLTESKRHPGFLVMDEPCQHSMKEASLQHLFEYCASITDKQIILFCSSQPKTEEYTQKEQPQNLIGQLAENVIKEGLDLTYIGIDPKAITLSKNAIS